MKKILIIGATSAITLACARLWAKQGCEFFLVARNDEKLAQVASDLLSRGANSVTTHIMDSTDFTKFPLMLNQCLRAFHQIDIALIGHGTLSDQVACEQSVDLTYQEILCNGTSVVALMTLLANQFSIQKCGCLAVISSVAGDRGRKSNYVYGSAKGLVGIFTQGLQHRFAKTRVKIVLIKPGPTDTPMTSQLKSKGMKLAGVDTVAQVIVEGVNKGKPVIYAPGKWAFIMLIIRFIPNFIFNKLDI